MISSLVVSGGDSSLELESVSAGSPGGGSSGSGRDGGGLSVSCPEEGVRDPLGLLSSLSSRVGSRPDLWGELRVESETDC